MTKPRLILVTPYLRSANNGNWQTASRWAGMLREAARVTLCDRWDGRPAEAMIALHARRSAASIHAWAQQQPGRPLGVVLTGTDLYRDIHADATAAASLEFAGGLAVLQPEGVAALPPAHRAKARVIYQSCAARQALPKTDRVLRAIAVGHLREEKAPDTLFAAARALAPAEGIRIDHVGGGLDPALQAAAETTAAACPHYRWLGALPHAATRRRIQQAHLLAHPSRMEGGAHVLMEAVRSGTPVLASRIDGNIGMLGKEYPGYFTLGDADELAALLRRCRATQSQSDGLLAQLARQAAALAPRFSPDRERTDLRQWLHELLLTAKHP